MPSAQVMTTTHCPLKTEENLDSAMPTRGVPILRRAGLAVARGQHYCLKQPLPRAARTGQVQVQRGRLEEHRHTAGHCPMQPGTPCHCRRTQLCPGFQGPGAPGLTPTCPGPSCTWGVNRPQPGQGLCSAARGAGLSLTTCSCRCVLSEGKVSRVLAESTALRTRKVVLLHF